MKPEIVIRWSEEDRCFVVFLPEFEDAVMQPVTHGETYEEALGNAREVIGLLIGEARSLSEYETEEFALAACPDAL